MLTLHEVLSVNPIVIISIDDKQEEMMILNPERGKYMVINVTGARLVQLADGSRTLGEIADLIAREFGANSDLVSSDIVRFANTLVDREILLSVRQMTG